MLRYTINNDYQLLLQFTFTIARSIKNTFQHSQAVLIHKDIKGRNK